MISVFWFNGQKPKYGRGRRATGPPRTTELLLDQGERPTRAAPAGAPEARVEPHLQPELLREPKYAYYNTGFSLTPRGGDKPEPRPRDRHRPWARPTSTSRFGPQHTVNADGNYFASGMGGNHELKFGFGYRKATVDLEHRLGGNQIVAMTAAPPTASPIVWRDHATATEGTATRGYAGRHVHQGPPDLEPGRSLRPPEVTTTRRARADANPAFPDLLPGLDFDGRRHRHRVERLSPRVGFTYALDESRKTVVRGSYARYACQLPLGDSHFDNPIGSRLPRLRLERHERRRLRPAGRGTDGRGAALLHGHRPQQPERRPHLAQQDRPELQARTSTTSSSWASTTSWAPNLAIGAAYTYRKSNDLSYNNRIGMTPADFTANPATTVNALDGNSYTANTFSPNAALVDAGNGRTHQDQHPGLQPQLQVASN